MASSVTFADKVQVQVHVFEADTSKQKIDAKEFGDAIFEIRRNIAELIQLENNTRRIKHLGQRDLTEDQKDELNQYIDQFNFRYSYAKLERVS